MDILAFDDPVSDRKNSADQVYTAIRERILDGRLHAGQALKERSLCHELNVSRTPVREALRRLSAEGLAEVRPRRSIVVAKFDNGEIGEIFELGLILESFVAGLAAEKATPRDIERLERLVADMEAVLSAGGDAAAIDYVRLDQAFHDALSSIARNRRVADILRQTVSFRVLMKVFADYSPADFDVSLAQHKTIVRAVASGNADWAAAAMRSHVRTGQQVREDGSGMPNEAQVSR